MRLWTILTVRSFWTALAAEELIICLAFQAHAYILVHFTSHAASFMLLDRWGQKLDWLKVASAAAQLITLWPGINGTSADATFCLQSLWNKMCGYDTLNPTDVHLSAADHSCHDNLPSAYSGRVLSASFQHSLNLHASAHLAQHASSGCSITTVFGYSSLSFSPSRRMTCHRSSRRS